MARRRPIVCTLDSTPIPLVRRWLLRILVQLNGLRAFVQIHGFNSDVLAEAVGLGHWLTDDTQEFKAHRALADLRERHRLSEEHPGAAETPPILHENVKRLASLVGLTETDCRILEFAVLLHSEHLLDDAADYLGNLTSVKVYHALSVILACPETEIRSALSPEGALARSGLLSIDRRGSSTLRAKLDLLSDVFADLMMAGEANPLSLLRGTVAPATGAMLALADYGHLQAMLDILMPYLRQSSKTGRRGVNVFLHGPPGTGKSQLARVIAAELDLDLFEVASEDADGDPVNGERRLRAFRVAQSFFAQRKALVVFDEVEDVFNDGDSLFGKKSTAQVRKAWINRMLEDNPVPTIWLSNSLSGLDPAFIRRFDMTFEVPVPPKSQRERLLHEQCSDLLDARAISRIADVDTLAPAVVVKASAVVRLIGAELGPARSAAAIERLLSNTLEAQGHQALRRDDPDRLPEVYDPAFIHADTDLRRLADGLTKAQSGRLCLYGPPGTGKTAYGRWLAARLQKPLLVKRASDLMSMWVGQNEKNIAQAFRQAERDGALLLIDEVDSFLQDRRDAQRGWEVTLVNEMLTQMESFPGVFIASTNLMAGLDPAALRRFDLKVKFDFLRAPQAWDLLRRYCTALQLRAPGPVLKARMHGLDRLTPGDFAAVMRQHRFRPIESAADFVQALEGECALKAEKKAPIGFY